MPLTLFSDRNSIKTGFEVHFSVFCPFDHISVGFVHLFCLSIYVRFVRFCVRFVCLVRFVRFYVHFVPFCVLFVRFDRFVRFCVRFVCYVRFVRFYVHFVRLTFFMSVWSVSV